MSVEEERPFAVRSAQRDTGVIVVASGEIDLWSAPEVKAALAGQGARDSAVVLDLRGVTFMDSSGLGLIVEANQRARKQGYRFAVAVGGASDVHRILEMSGLMKVLKFVDDPDAFLAGEAP
jgi:anti-anti-sigma factor